ncbi:MAG TPA: hypothetical protein VM223_10310 [Planctomycetota bacterium]|nr:hypothetical protein [Planctomycetota bacterium]
MLHAVTKKQGWVAINPPYAILDGETEVAEVHYAPSSRRGQVISDGLTYEAYSQGAFVPTYVLDLEGAPLVEVRRPKFFTLSHTVACAGGQTYTLRPASFFSRRYLLLDNGQPVGEIRPEGFWGIRFVIDLPPVIPVPVQAFLFWVVRTIRERNRDSS